MYNNNWWIIILILLFFGCGNYSFNGCCGNTIAATTAATTVAATAAATNRRGTEHQKKGRPEASFFSVRKAGKTSLFCTDFTYICRICCKICTIITFCKEVNRIIAQQFFLCYDTKYEKKDIVPEGE